MKNQSFQLVTTWFSVIKQLSSVELANDKISLLVLKKLRTVITVICYNKYDFIF